jgi:DNA-binding PadR family transcriptional regulator
LIKANGEQVSELDMIEFSDGSKAETTGELRIEEGANGWYVLGDGIILPAMDREEAEFLLETILSRGIYVAMKMLKSEGFRERVRTELASRGQARP